MPRMHAASAWATSTSADRVVMLLIGLASLVVAGWLWAAGHHSAGISVLCIAALAAVAFTLTALAEDEPLPDDAAGSAAQPLEVPVQEMGDGGLHHG